GVDGHALLMLGDAIDGETDRPADIEAVVADSGDGTVEGQTALNTSPSRPGRGRFLLEHDDVRRPGARETFCPLGPLFAAGAARTEIHAQQFVIHRRPSTHGAICGIRPRPRAPPRRRASEINKTRARG